MTIDTEFNLGQSVWFMNDNKPYQSVVGKIVYSIIDKPIEKEILYGFRIPKPYARSSNEFTWKGRSESDVFATKAELLNSM